MATFIQSSMGATLSAKFQAGRVRATDGLRPQRFVDGAQITGGPSAYVALSSLSEVMNPDTGTYSYVGVPLGVQGGTERIFVEGETSSPGAIYLEVAGSASGPWTVTDSETVPAGVYLQAVASTANGEGAFRLRFVPTPGGRAELLFVAQARQ
jgi:hypothetical protein